MTATQLFALGLQTANIRRSDSQAYDISCLLEEICGISRPMLPIRGTEEISQEHTDIFMSLVKRLINCEPLQYLLGKWEFYGLPFFVGPGVLIPRQDTEVLAECAINFLRTRKNGVAADLCSGSGCLAGAIAHETGAKMYALELSKEALFYLRKNMAALNLPVQIIEADILTPPLLPSFDLIISNPPYIPQYEMDTLDACVRYEPDMALCAGEDGYNFYRKIPQIYHQHLKFDGVLMLEVGYNQSVYVAELMKSMGYTDIRCEKDLAGIDRVVIGKKAAVK